MCKIVISVRALVEPEERKGIQRVLARALVGILEITCFEWRREGDGSTLTVRGGPVTTDTEVDEDSLADLVGKEADVQVVY